MDPSNVFLMFLGKILFRNKEDYTFLNIIIIIEMSSIEIHTYINSKFEIIGKKFKKITFANFLI